MIEVEGPDGTVIEFPDDTPPDTIKGVMAKHYKVQSGRTGKSYDFDVPDGADPIDAAQSALMAQEPETVERPVFADSGTTTPPTALEAFGGAAQNALGQLTIGAGILPDYASMAGNALNNAFVNAGAAVADPVLRGFGADRAADAVGRFAERTTSQPAPTIEGVVRRTNPVVNQPGNALANFGFQALGGLAVPFGPKAAPVRPRAPVAAPAKGASNKLVPFADEIVAAGKRERVPVLTTDVKPPRTMMGKAARNVGERIPIAGTGGVRSGQNQSRIDAATRLVEDFGGSDDAVNAVAADLAKTRSDELSKLTAAKTSVIEGTPGAVEAPRALRAISEQITRLQGINAEAFKPVIDKLKSFEEVLESGKSLSQIEGNRKLLGDLFSDPSLAAIKGDGQKALNAIYGPLRDDMGAFIEQAGGSVARAKWQGANARLAAMAGELDAAAFKKVLNEVDTTPEGAAKLIFSKTPSEVNRLAANLSPAGKVKARAAVMFEAARKSSENGVGPISPEKFSTALNAMQSSIKGLFDPADAARIGGMVRLLKGTKRASEAGVMTNSGMQVAPYAIGAGAVQAPLLTITAGVASRLYESGPMRDLLLRLGRAKPGTPAYKITWDRLNTALAKMAPVAANDVEAGIVASPTRVAAEDKEQN